MGNIITPVLPHDLPENWNDTQYVSPGGTEVGLTEKHGYNYLMKQVNNSQKAINELDAEMEDIDTTLQNKAPAGYGLGTAAAELPSTNLDSITYNGWYIIGSTSGLTNPPPFGWGVLHVYSRNSNNVVQEVLGADKKVRRYCADGTWQPWEWVNPPFIKDVVYRTTERHLDNPVYKKMDSNGVIWWSTDQSTWKRESERVGSYSKTETDTLLENKASLATQQTVEKKNVPTKYIPSSTSSMAASELPAYLASLPKLITDTLIIRVSGELNAELNINNFYGSGNLKITAVDSGFTAKQPVYISHCTVPVMLENLQMTAPAGLPAESSLCNITNSRYVRLDTCTVTGHEKEAYVYGINASDGSRVICENCSVSGFHAVVLATRTTTIAIYGGSNDYSDNTYGAYVWHGGIIMLYGSVSDTLGGSANLKQGGLIVKSDSTLI